MVEFHFDASAVDRIALSLKYAQLGFKGVVTDVFEEAGPELVTALTLDTPIGSTGKLANSTGYEILDLGDVIRLEVTQPALSRAFGHSGRVIYRPFVASGRRSGGKPPYQALIDWVRVVLAVPQHKVKNAAFRLAISMGKRGTRQHYLRREPYTHKTVKNNQALFSWIANEIGSRITVIATDIRRR